MLCRDRRLDSLRRVVSASSTPFSLSWKFRFRRWPLGVGTRASLQVVEELMEQPQESMIPWVSFSSFSTGGTCLFVHGISQLLNVLTFLALEVRVASSSLSSSPSADRSYIVEIQYHHRESRTCSRTAAKPPAAALAIGTSSSSTLTTSSWTSGAGVSSRALSSSSSRNCRLLSRGGIS